MSDESEDSDESVPTTVPGGGPILTAKLRTATTRSPVIVRPRLFDLVSDGARGPLTLVTAPAGSGKTLLISSWIAAHHAPGSVAWLTMDAGDAASGVFWCYLLAGLAHAGVDITGIDTPTRREAVEPALLARLAARLAQRTHPVVLVLDNGHVLRDSPIPDDLDFLIRNSGPQLRIIIMARMDPTLPLHRYRVDGSVTEIRYTDLAFTAAEVEALLSAYDLDLPAATVRGLADATQGWAASLRLTALALRNRHGYMEATHPDSDLREHIAEYFIAEVLNGHPPDLREFLLRTSLVDRVSPALAEALTGCRDASRSLADLAHTNPFVTRSPHDRGCYEYHPLVRELLRRQLRQEINGRTVDLHRRAARWFSGERMLGEATNHLAAAGDWDQAARLIVDQLAVGSLLVGPLVGRKAARFAGMPPEVGTAEAAVVRAALALADPNIQRSRDQLHRAKVLADSRPGEEASRRLRLAIALTEAVRAQRAGDTTAVLTAGAAARSALTGLPDWSAPDGQIGPHELILATEGSTLLRAGELDPATGALTNALRVATEAGCGYLQVRCLGELGLAAALRGQLRRAARYGARAAAVAERCRLGIEERPSAGAVALAWTHAERYEMADALTYAEQASGSADLDVEPVSASLLALVRARIRRANGDPGGAIALIASAQDPHVEENLPGWLRYLLLAAEAVLRAPRGPSGRFALIPSEAAEASPHCAMAQAKLHLLNGETSVADAGAARLLERTDLPLDVRVSGWLIRAACSLGEGRAVAARAAIEEATSLAEPETMRRPLFEAPRGLRRLLRPDNGTPERRSWLGPASPVPPDGPLPARRAIEPGEPVIPSLTDKEREVLRHLEAMLSTEEIAQTMFVSVNTVKTHVRAILRKLAAGRRSEAVRRARELGLV